MLLPLPSALEHVQVVELAHSLVDAPAKAAIADDVIIGARSVVVLFLLLFSPHPFRLPFFPQSRATTLLLPPASGQLPRELHRLGEVRAVLVVDADDATRRRRIATLVLVRGCVPVPTLTLLLEEPRPRLGTQRIQVADDEVKPRPDGRRRQLGPDGVYAVCAAVGRDAEGCCGGVVLLSMAYFYFLIEWKAEQIRNYTHPGSTSQGITGRCVWAGSGSTA